MPLILCVSPSTSLPEFLSDTTGSLLVFVFFHLYVYISIFLFSYVCVSNRIDLGEDSEVLNPLVSVF